MTGEGLKVRTSISTAQQISNLQGSIYDARMPTSCLSVLTPCDYDDPCVATYKFTNTLLQVIKKLLRILHKI